MIKMKMPKLNGVDTKGFTNLRSVIDPREALKGTSALNIPSKVVGDAVFGKDNKSPLSNIVHGDWKDLPGSMKSHAGDKAKAAQAEMEARENQQYGQNQEYNKQLGGVDDAYAASMKGNADKYQSDLDTLKGETEAAQKDANATYTNQTQPRLKNLMESAQKNSEGAMSLQEAMDPNNKVAASTRQLYADQGKAQQQAYNDEAEKIRGSYDSAAQKEQDRYDQKGQELRGLYKQQGEDQRNAYNTEGQSLRDLFNQQGTSVQNQYEQQAQGEGRKGLADVGVLSALGMQNMAGQLGGVPMTGGQLQAMMGANQAQSGAAYAQTQRRLQSLRDQGLQGNLGLQNQGLGLQGDTRLAGLGRSSDLQNQGLGTQASTSLTGLGQGASLRGQGLGQSYDTRLTGLGRASDLQNQGMAQGFNRSDTAYGQGLDSQDRYRNSVGDYEKAGDRQLGRDADFRNQRGGYANQSYGLASQMSDINRGVGQGKTMRDMAAYNTHMGGQQANTAGQISQINAQQAQQGAMQTGALQAAGTAAGAYFGGPAGAAAGGQAGQQVGKANAPEQYSVPQAGNYRTSYGEANAGQPQATPQGLSLDQDGFQANPYAYNQNGPARKRRA